MRFTVLRDAGGSLFGRRLIASRCLPNLVAKVALPLGKFIRFGNLARRGQAVGSGHVGQGQIRRVNSEAAKATRA